MYIYARQIKPEYQESPLCWDNYDTEMQWPEVAIFGNTHYGEHIPEMIKRVMDVLDKGELCDDLQCIRDRGRGYSRYCWNAYDHYGNVTAAIMDYLEPVHKEKYSTKEIHDLVRLVLEYDGDDGDVCRVLSIMTGRSWTDGVIRGCCQGDWQNIIYPEDKYSRKSMEYLEADYFNTGSEWMIHDGDGIPDEDLEGEDISGFCTYCYSWNSDGIAKELLDAAMADENDSVIMWSYYDGRQEHIGSNDMPENEQAA